MKKIIIVFLFLTSACTHSVHLVNFSDQMPNVKQGTPVSSKAEQFVIMGFAGDTNYVNEAYTKLMSECRGNVTGIITKFYTDHGFFSWTNRVEMDGFCIN